MKAFGSTILTRILATLLWLVTALLGLGDIYLAREILFALYARFSTEAAPAMLMGDVLVVVLALVYVGFVIATGEYHLKNVGQPGSWRLFWRTLVVELSIPLLAYFV